MVLQPGNGGFRPHVALSHHYYLLGYAAEIQGNHCTEKLSHLYEVTLGGEGGADQTKVAYLWRLGH